MWLSVRNGGGGELASRAMPAGSLTVGRDPRCDLVLADPSVAPFHARLTPIAPGQVVIEALTPGAPLGVEGQLMAVVTVGPGRAVRLGSATLVLSADAPAPSLPPPPPTPPRSPVLPPPPAVPAPPVSGPTVPAPPASRPAVPPGPPRGTLPPPPSLPPRPPFSPASPFPPAPGNRRRWAWPLATVAAALAGALVATGLLADPFRGSHPRTYSAAQLDSRWGPSTLYIQTDVGGHPLDSGSAWVLDAARGLIVTNAHVVDSGPPSLGGLGSSPATTYRVGQGKHQQPATLVGVAPCEDLAVLRIGRTKGLRSFVLGRQSDVHDGDPVTALGYPGAGTRLPDLTVTTGTVSNRRTSFTLPSLETPQYRDLIQITTPIDPGNSGGPLLDAHGQLVGINTATITEEGDRTIQGESFAIGIDRAKAVLHGLSSGHSEGYAGFNFVFPSSSNDFESYNLPFVAGGIIVPTAQIGSPAYRAGFGHGQALILTSIDGQRLNGSLPSYCKLVGTDAAGTTATFGVESSSGSTRQVKVTFQ